MERRPVLPVGAGTGRRRRPADKDPKCEDGSASAGAERRAGKGTPTSGRHRPPQAAGREGPRLRRWFGFNRGRATRRQGNADLRSAQAAAGGRQTRTPTAAGMVRLRPGQSDAQARERRPLVGTGRRRRPADKDPDCGDGSALYRGRATRRQGNADLRSAQAAAGGRQTRTPSARMVRLRPGAERRAGKGTPTSGRHRPPQAAGRQGPQVRGWFGFGRGQSDAQARERRPPVGTGRRRRPAEKDPDCGDGSALYRGQSDAQARERRPPVGTGRRRRPADKDPKCEDGSASAGAERRAGKGTPTSGRHRPPQAAGRQGPQVRGWFGFNRGRATRRQGNADLRSAQAAAGGRQTRTPTAEMVRLSTGTPVFSVIRTAAWYTPLATAPPAPARYRERFFLYSRVRRTGVPAKP